MTLPSTMQGGETGGKVAESENVPVLAVLYVSPPYEAVIVEEPEVAE